MSIKPWTVGAIKGREGFPKEKVELAEKRVSQATKLADLADQYHFYTPALLYTYVRLMGREPFHDFSAEYGQDVVPISLKFDKPMFAGLEVDSNPAWNHYIYGMEHQHFANFLGWLGSLVFNDSELGYVARTRYREIEVADPMHLAKLVTIPKEVPMVKIVVVCLDTNRGCHYIEPAKNPLLDLPSYRYTDQSFDDTTRFADAVLAGSGDPYTDMYKGQAKDGMSVEERELRERVAKTRRNPDGGYS